jgi:hypothetical protein
MRNNPLSTFVKFILGFLFALIILLTASWLYLGVVISYPLVVALIGLALLIASALAWATSRTRARLWIYVGLLVLAGLVLPTSVLVGNTPDTRAGVAVGADVSLLISIPAGKFSDFLPQPIANLLAFTLFLMPSVALVVAALLLHSGLNNYKEWKKTAATEAGSPPVKRAHTIRLAAACFVLSALLLAKTLHNLYWLTVWDDTYDSGGFIWLVVPVLVAVFSGVMLTLTLPGRVKWSGIYALLIPALMITVSACAQRVDLLRLTEVRAERASHAIESYYNREGRYPQDLRQVTPWYVLSLPGPVIIYGQGWCYDGGDDYYRLGYVYREDWSAPLKLITGRIYKTQGEVPDLHLICYEEIAALKKRDQ